MNQQRNYGLSPKIGTEDRQSPACSDDFRLADERPLWYTLLNDPDALVMDAAEADRARAEFRDLFRIKPDIVRECVDTNKADPLQVKEALQVLIRQARSAP